MLYCRYCRTNVNFTPIPKGKAGHSNICIDCGNTVFGDNKEEHLDWLKQNVKTEKRKLWLHLGGTVVMAVIFILFLLLLIGVI